MGKSALFATRICKMNVKFAAGCQRGRMARQSKNLDSKGGFGMSDSVSNLDVHVVLVW